MHREGGVPIPSNQENKIKDPSVLLAREKAELQQRGQRLQEDAEQFAGTNNHVLDGLSTEDRSGVISFQQTRVGLTRVYEAEAWIRSMEAIGVDPEQIVAAIENKKDQSQ